MGEYSHHGLFYVPDIGESNSNKSLFDDSLDEAARLIQEALKIIGPDSVLNYYLQAMIIGRYVDSSGNRYFSTEVCNGGDPAI